MPHRPTKRPPKRRYWMAYIASLAVSALVAKRQVADWPITSVLIAAMWFALCAFSLKVWEELQEDAVQGVAMSIRAVFRKAGQVLIRLWSALGRWLRAWSPSRVCFTWRYLREVRRAFGLFNDKGLGLINANRLDIDKVYVELKAAGDVNLNRPRLNLLASDIHGRASFWEHLHAMRTCFAMAIIGAPGIGKTTLLQHVLLTYARNRQWRKFRHWWKFGQWWKFGRRRIPFFIELRKVRRELWKGKDAPPLDNLIEDVIKQSVRGLRGKLPRGWVNSMLRFRQCILLWDGLDEVAEVSERKRIAAWLDQYVAETADAGVLSLVSARSAGYRGAPLDRAHVLEVQRFDYNDTCRFIAQWYLANEIVSHGNKNNAEVRARADQEAVDLRDRLAKNPRLSALTGNPLLLTMICMVHRYHGALPGSRGQLYAEICQVLLERWRQGKGIEDSYSGEQKVEVLRHLAAYMMEKCVKELCQEELAHVLTAPLSFLGLGTQELRTFLDQLQEGSGLVLELAPGMWGFAHLTFQEYLCADYWTQHPDCAPVNWAAKILESWWRETVLLYAAKARDAGPVVMAAVDARSAPALVLALAMRSERPRLRPEARERLEDVVARAIESHEPEIFAPAGEAMLVHLYEDGFRAVNSGEQRELSRWITQAEYQLFMLQRGSTAGFHCLPRHWVRPWFTGRHDAPITGITESDAEEYCAWLDSTFLDWSHSLPCAGDITTAEGSSESHELLLFFTKEALSQDIFAHRTLLKRISNWLVSENLEIDTQKALEDYGRTLGLLYVTLDRDLGASFIRLRSGSRNFKVGLALAHALDKVLGLRLIDNPELEAEFARSIARVASSVVEANDFGRDLAQHLSGLLAPEYNVDRKSVV